jgi:thiol-disulfide isomerase/thioredoxin
MPNKILKARFLATVFVVMTFTLLAPLHGNSSKDAPKAELSLKDLNGKRARLRDYQGKIIVLNFWATWCIPCSEEMPMLVETEKKYDGRGVVFIGASLDDDKTKSQVPVFLQKYQVTFPIWAGASGDDLERLQMGPAVPATAFLDQEGHIVARIEGQMRAGEIEERLDWLLAGKAGTAPQALVTHLEKH